MPIQISNIQLALVTALACDVIVARRNARRHAKLMKLYVDNIADYNQLATKYNEVLKFWQEDDARIDYLLHVLDVNEVEVDEFDKIVMNDPK